MKILKSGTRRLFTKLAVMTVLTTSTLTLADEHKHHHAEHILKVENAFATPTFALAKMGAGYFTLRNTGDKDVAITEVSIAPDVARIVELHETWFDGELAKMRQLDMPFIIKAGGSAEFVPQGKHLMLMGLKSPLEKGDSFDVSLTFASGQKQVVSIPVMDKPGAKSGHHHH